MASTEQVLNDLLNETLPENIDSSGLVAGLSDTVKAQPPASNNNSAFNLTNGPMRGVSADEEQYNAPEVQTVFADDQGTYERATTDILRGSPNLQRLGVLPGDLLRDNLDGTKTVDRVVSGDNSFAIPEGAVATRDIINGSPTLQGLNVQVGDILYRDEEGVGRVYDMGVHGAVTGLEYGFDSSENIVTDLSHYLGARFPIPDVFNQRDPQYEEVYNKFNDTSFEERLDIIARQKELDIIEEYGYGAVLNNRGNAYQTVGSIGKVLLDPTNLIPFAAGRRAAMVSGAAILGGSELAHQLGTEGAVDVNTVAGTAALGGLGAGAIVNVANRMSQRAAVALTKKVERLKVQAIAEGKTGAAVTEHIVARTGISPAVMERAAERAGSDLVFTGGAKEATELLEQQYIAGQIGYWNKFKRGSSYIFETMSSAIGKVNKPLMYKLRGFEAGLLRGTQQAMLKVEPFVVGLSKLPKATQATVQKLLINGKHTDLAKYLGRVAPDLVGELATTKQLLQSLYKQQRKAGIDVKNIPDFFPRSVNDLDALRMVLGAPTRNYVKKQMDTYSEGIGRALTPEDRAHVMDMLFQKRNAKIVNKAGDKTVTFVPNARGGAIGSTNNKAQRVIDEVTDELLPYYDSTVDSLGIYLRKTIQDIEMSKMLGKSRRKDADGRFNAVDSFGDLAQREVDAGRMPLAAVEDIEKLLSIRFVKGVQSPHAMMRVLRDLGYFGTIVNPVSAIRQLGDLANSAWINGLRNTLRAVAQPKHLKMIDAGLADISAEMGNPGLISRKLSQSLGLVGFRGIDRLGKETLMNAAFLKAQKQARSTAGIAKLERKYGSVYGDEFPQFIDDLKTGTISPNVRTYAFNELADAQPISLLEMPAGFVENPNLRILYTLKSFTIKMYDAAINKTYKEIKYGNAKEGYANLIRLLAYVTVANGGTEMLRSMARNKPIVTENVPEDALWALLGVYGFNKYGAERYIQNGDLTGFAFNTITPATPLIDSALSLGADAIKGDVKELDKYLGPVPYFGDLVKNWFYDQE